MALYKIEWKVAAPLAWLALVVIGVSATGSLAQEKDTIKSIQGSVMIVRPLVEIPDAKQPCDPASCEWWKKIRRAGMEISRKDDEKTRKVFAGLFLEGMEKGYTVALDDRPAQMLTFSRPISLPANKKKKGVVRMMVELRSDASIGEIKVLESLGEEIDDVCMSAVRQNFFIPAVKNGRFVSEFAPAAFGFGVRP